MECGLATNAKGDNHEWEKKPRCDCGVAKRNN